MQIPKLKPFHDFNDFPQGVIDMTLQVLTSLIHEEIRVHEIEDDGKITFNKMLTGEGVAYMSLRDDINKSKDKEQYKVSEELLHTILAVLSIAEKSRVYPLFPLSEIESKGHMSEDIVSEKYMTQTGHAVSQVIAQIVYYFSHHSK